MIACPGGIWFWQLIDFLGAAKTFIIMGINKYYFINFEKLIKELRANLNGVILLNASLELFQELIKISFGIFIIYFLLKNRQMEFEIFIVLWLFLAPQHLEVYLSTFY